MGSGGGGSQPTRSWADPAASDEGASPLRRICCLRHVALNAQTFAQYIYLFKVTIFGSNPSHRLLWGPSCSGGSYLGQMFTWCPSVWLWLLMLPEHKDCGL